MPLGALATLHHIETRTVLAWNRANLRPWPSRLFGFVSRLGDGVFWYVVIGALPLLRGRAGLVLGLRMLLTGLVCTVLYAAIKRSVRRPRPCRTLDGIHETVAPLDHFSFPSGHTMHAVAFTVLAVAEVPGLGWLLVPFTILVATSRLVLGLHYLSDVLAGALLGGGLATLARLVG